LNVQRTILAECLGSLLLTGTVIGSGILASQLTDNGAVALLGNTGATASILYVLITVFGPISGAHFNPAVTLVAVLRRELKLSLGLIYALAQIAGCAAGAMLAHAMFALPLWQSGQTVRSGGAQILSEGVATFTLVLTILGVMRHRPQAIGAAVALVIAAGYWWTASTSFANPAITLARALSDTFAGIRPDDVPGFIAGQFAGAVLALGVFNVLFPKQGGSA
jgi:glycerol uptake facilitator-like aquaporin